MRFLLDLAWREKRQLLQLVDAFLEREKLKQKVEARSAA